MRLFLIGWILFSLGAGSLAWADYTWEGVPAGYGLVWSDEFNGTVGSAPNSSNWGYDTGESGWGNNELENYTNSTANAQIVSDPNAVDGKALAIIALDPGGNNDAVGDYTSARLNSYSKQSFTYGYMVARIKMPYGDGIWPAFWMLGNDIDSGFPWPSCGEMDIMENIGNASTYNSNPPDQANNHGSLHDGSSTANEESATALYTISGPELFHQAYHTFAALWQANEIQFFVDGNLYETDTPANESSWAFNNNPSFFILNMAVGGYWPGNPDSSTSFPQTMYVDDVRVYQSGQPTPTPVVQSIWRVHCGGDTYTDGDGNTWGADTNFTGGSPSYSGTAISGTVSPTSSDSSLYQYQRYGNATGGEAVTYIFDVPTGTTYQVLMKFAETYWTSSGQRLFNYSINGVTEESNFDIFATAGGANKALDEAYDNISPDANGKITLVFTAGTKDNPTVGAIQIIPMSDVPVPTATNTPCGFPGNTCTPTWTPTPTYTPTRTWTATITFTPTPTWTPTVTSTVNVTASETPWVWPNPYNGNGNLTLEIPLLTRSNVQVSLFTVAFRKIADQTFYQEPMGWQSLILKTVDQNQDSLANGLYYVRIVTSTGQKILKLLILR